MLRFMPNTIPVAVVVLEYPMKALLSKSATVRTLVLAAGMLLASLPAPAAETNEAPAVAVTRGGLDESAFNIISERNIFNSKRTGSIVRGGSSRIRVIESFALTGTMDYEKGKFAFFEGTSTEFTKTLKPDGFIAGYKVVEILPHSVKLELSGKVTELEIGTGMRREDRGPWTVAEVTLPTSSYGVAGGTTGRDFGRDSGRNMGTFDRSTFDRGTFDRSTRNSRTRDPGSFNSYPSRTTSSASTSTSASAADTADQSEVLKRLMERRAKEE